MKTIGYIGLGIMGSAMAGNLLKAGFGVVAHNRTQGKARPLLDAGAKWAASPAEAARRSDVVCVNVTDTPDVESVIFGDGGIVEGAAGRSGLVVVDHSTISPAATRDMARRLAERGIEFLDAPVTGGDVGARAGTLSIMVGGEASTLERVMPMLQAVGKTITHLGPAGAGQACKACNQILCAVNLMGVCEALGLAVREGIDVRKVLAVTTAGAGGSWSLANLGPRIAEGDMAPGFMIDLILKDLAIVQAESKGTGLPMPATGLAAELFRAATMNGEGRSGTQAVSRVYELLGKLKYCEEKA